MVSGNQHCQSIRIPTEKIAFVISTVSGASIFRGFSCVLRTEKPLWFPTDRPGHQRKKIVEDIEFLIDTETSGGRFPRRNVKSKLKS